MARAVFEDEPQAESAATYLRELGFNAPVQRHYGIVIEDSPPL